MTHVIDETAVKKNPCIRPFSIFIYILSTRKIILLFRKCVGQMNVGRLIMVSIPSRPVLFTCFCSVQVPIPCSSGLPYGTRACTRRITTAGTTRKRKVTTAPTRRVAIPHEAGLILQAPIPRSEGSLTRATRVTSPRMGRVAIPDTTAARSARVGVTVSRGVAPPPATLATRVFRSIPTDNCTRPGVVEIGGV